MRKNILFLPKSLDDAQARGVATVDAFFKGLPNVIAPRHEIVCSPDESHGAIVRRHLTPQLTNLCGTLNKNITLLTFFTALDRCPQLRTVQLPQTGITSDEWRTIVINRKYCRRARSFAFYNLYLNTTAGRCVFVDGERSLLREAVALFPMNEAAHVELAPRSPSSLLLAAELGNVHALATLGKHVPRGHAVVLRSGTVVSRAKWMLPKV